MRDADHSLETRPRVVSIVSYITRVVWISLVVCVCFYVFNVDKVPDRPSLGFKTEDAFFLWHPLLMVIGFTAFATEALFAFVSHPASDSHVRGRRSWHVFCHILTLICVLGGLAGVFGSRTIEKESWLPDTPHGFLGTTALILYFAQVFLGATNLLGSRGGKGKFHSFLGLSVYFIALATIVAGFVQHSAKEKEFREIARSMMPAYAVLALLVAYHFQNWTTADQYEPL
ncbi:hypothetical protein BSKO_05858 [Bryopsis sp. KO-2023]|nr:hypothetical protein BSKO_05858 [Bryopsis sp. KO-2023]